jgi:hypothetical protein
MLRLIIELVDSGEEWKKPGYRVCDELWKPTDRELAAEAEILKALGLRVMYPEEAPEADIQRHVVQRFITKVEQPKTP